MYLLLKLTAVCILACTAKILLNHMKTEGTSVIKDLSSCKKFPLNCSGNTLTRKHLLK